MRLLERIFGQRDFFHWSLVSTHNKKLRVGPITKIGDVGHEFEYRLLYDRGNIINAIVWCPKCGYELDGGPEGGAAVNAVCDLCKINFGNINYFSGRDNSGYVSPSIHRRRLLWLRSGEIASSQDGTDQIPEHVLACYAEWAPTYRHLQSLICKPAAGIADNFDITFWNKYGFELVTVAFQGAAIVVAFPSIVKHTDSSVVCEMIDPMWPRSNTGTLKPIDGIEVLYDLNDPKSLVGVEQAIKTLDQRYYNGYLELLKTAERMRNVV